MQINFSRTLRTGLRNLIWLVKKPNRYGAHAAHQNSLALMTPLFDARCIYQRNQLSSLDLVYAYRTKLFTHAKVSAVYARFTEKQTRQFGLVYKRGSPGGNQLVASMLYFWLDLVYTRSIELNGHEIDLFLVKLGSHADHA